jgi:hypothetical protein
VRLPVSVAPADGITSAELPAAACSALAAKLDLALLEPPPAVTTLRDRAAGAVRRLHAAASPRSDQATAARQVSVTE